MENGESNQGQITTMKELSNFTMQKPSRPEHEKLDIQELQILLPNIISCVNLVIISGC